MRKINIYISFFVITFQFISIFVNAQLDAPNLTFSVPGSICSQYYSFFCIDGATGYEVNFSTYSDFSDDVQIFETEVCNFHFPTLYFNTDYYFRIRAYNETDTSEWSNVQSFTTYSYSNVNTDILGNGNFSAIETSLPCATVCWWETDTVNTFDSPFLHRDTTYDEHEIIFNAPFYFCTNYYVRVKSVTLIDTTPNWSYTSWNYIEIPCAVSLISPNDITFSSSFTELEIERFPQPLRYVFQLDTTTDFTNPREYEIEDTDESDQVSVEDLYFETTHYWRVRAINSIDTSQWSSVFSFGMGTVHPMYPVDGEITNTNTSLSIADIGNIIGYLFEYDTVPDFNSAAFVEINSPTSAIQLNSLDYEQTYYWRARVYHSLDTSMYTATRSFSTIACPELISPANESTGLKLKERLESEYQPGVSLYEYQMSENPEFPNGETTEISHTGFEENVQTDLLKFNTEYHWRARYINDNDTSVWSEVFAFSTIDVPVLILPANSASEVEFTQLMLQWQSIQYVDTYSLWVSTSSDFTEYDEYIQPSYGSIIYLVDLLPSTTYYWKVKATSAIDESDWSETWSFTTKNVSNINLENQIEMQVFPNPSSHNYTVKLELPSYNNAEIKIAGLNGHLKDVIPVTSETTVIATKGWKAGVYVCNLFIDGQLVKAEKLVFE
ncbi:MAG: T9SS type A sorting domain-containing protein [Bacteroidales bacterium]|nr:T9SS type A sorting domain-containing protein [Bacteroidales bacterium]